MTDPTSVAEPSARLVREWAACGIVASVSRFVPVPLLDDVLKERAARVALARTLKAHGRTYPVTDVQVLYTGADGVFATARKYVVSVPGRVLLFPVRKYVAVLGAVKGVPTDVMAVLLLGRTVHRALERGGLGGTDPKAVRQEARRLRRAYEAALDEMDLRLLAGALADGLSTGRDLASAAAGQARRLLSHDAPHEDPGDDAEVERGAEKVEEVLRRPEVSVLMAEFDQRVDAALGIA